MTLDQRERLREIHTLPSLVKYLREEMEWPIGLGDFEEDSDLFFDYSLEELGIDPKNAAAIKQIRRLRPLTTNQPFGVFFVMFEKKRLPRLALKRLLRGVVIKKRATANQTDQVAWQADDLLFISSYGEGEENARRISFAHFKKDPRKGDLPSLKVIDWDRDDTGLHLDAVASDLTEKLRWPGDTLDVNAWRKQWRSAFTLGYREGINTSKEMASRLARLACGIRDHIVEAFDTENENGPVTRLMRAFKEALIHDLKEDGFADMYAQTIAYGLLSARVANPSGKTVDEFAAAMPVTSPFLMELMETFLDVGGRKGRAGSGAGLDFDDLGVSEVVELLDAANMEAVVRDFGDRNPQEDPVIHFYELFLKEYDAKKRMQRGVFYTPRPVVSFIVRSVDEILRTEFGLEDGLADTTTWGEMAKRHKNLEIPEGISPNKAFVQILDPATGTGTFLVEVIGLIHKTMTAKWQTERHSKTKIAQLWNDYVPKHLLPRLHGYELLMAPYAISHMKIGLKLYETGYRFESDERARVYLTNSLEPPQDFSGTLAFAIPALAHEAEAVNAIKRDQRFTVLIGNPPYSKSSQNQGRWIVDLMEDYKGTVRIAETQIQALSDDYVKFMRFGHFVLQQTDAGLLMLITNNGYIDGPIFRDMRMSLSEDFGRIAIFNLHGDSRKNATPPDGMTDENVFDIQQGVAISSFLRKGKSDASSNVWYADIWGTRAERYSLLAQGTSKQFDLSRIKPERPFSLFIPVDGALNVEFGQGWHLYDVFGTGQREVDNHHSYGAGFVTQQDRFAIGFSEQELVDNVGKFLNPSIDKEELWERFRFCSTNQWSFERARQELRGVDIKAAAKRCLYRPFDYRYTVFDRNVCTIRRERITSQFYEKNIGLLTTRRVTRLPYNNVFATAECAEYKVASHDRNTIVFPLWISEGVSSGTVELFENSRRSNINPEFARALNRRLLLPEEVAPEDIFSYVYAVLHSPTYRRRYGELLKMDFPRVPLVGNSELFGELVRQGTEIIALHIMESPKLKDHVSGVVGSGLSQVEKVSYSDETVWIDRAKTQGFKGVPEEVWNFHIGGYQVCNKWLKDRQAKGGKNPRPGRVLTHEDIDHYQKIVVAISETIRIMQEIDEVIEEHGGWPGAFQTDEKKEEEAMPGRPVAG
jgi:type ISP restriction-modification system protein/Eco57I restriction-modification methylase